MANTAKYRLDGLLGLFMGKVKVFRHHANANGTDSNPVAAGSKIEGLEQRRQAQKYFRVSGGNAATYSDILSFCAGYPKILPSCTA